MAVSFSLAPRAGWAVTALVGAFLLVDAVGKLARLAPYVASSAQFGLTPNAVVAIGAVLLVSTVLYLVPRTSVLGAILLTGYLGGAAATHVEHPGSGSYGFAVAVGVLVWAGLYLREPRLHALVPLRRPDQP